MTTEQPRTTASADHTGRLTADGLRRGVSRWWYVVFLGALTFEPMFAAVGRRHRGHHRFAGRRLGW